MKFEVVVLYRSSVYEAWKPFKDSGWETARHPEEAYFIKVDGKYFSLGEEFYVEEDDDTMD